MRWAVAAVLIALAASSAAPAYAQFTTGNSLTEACQNDVDSRPFQAGRCFGLIIGLIDGVSAIPNNVCLPRDATAGQMVDLVKAHLARNPQSRHRPAAYLVAEALLQSFPCR